MASQHGFNVPIVLLIVGIYKVGVAGFQSLSQKCVRRLALFLDESLGHPLVPTGDKHELRIHTQGPLPLFCKVVAMRFLTGKAHGVDGRLGFIAVAAPDVAHRVLGHAHGEFLRDVRGLVPAVTVLGVIEPLPGVLAVGPGPAISDREEVANLLRETLGRAQDQRFALPLKPEIGVKPGFVEVIVEFGDGLGGTAVREEADLGCGLSFRSDLCIEVTESAIVFFIGEGIGDIKDQDVNPCILKHGPVPAHDIGAVREVIAQFRLAPVMKRTHRPPGRLVRVGV